MSRRSGERFLELELSEPLTGYDYAVEWVFALALVLSPLAYGTTNVWSQQILYGLIAVLALLAGLKLSLIRGTPLVFTWAYLPMLLYLAAVTLSVITLPEGIVRAIAPGTYEQKSQLMADIPNVGQLLNKLTITFNLWSTLRGLRLVLAMSVVFTVVMNLYRTPAQIKRLLATVAIAGVIVTLLTLAQNVSHDAGQPYRIYWDIPGISVDAVHPNAGPFAGKAQLGQYLNLTIGAMVALALVQIGETFRGEDPTGQEIIERLGATNVRVAVLLFVGAVMALTSLTWSLSRGAMLGAAVGGLVAAVLLLIKRGWRKRETVLLINGVIVVVVVLSLVYVLFEDRYGKLVASTGTSSDTRKMILKSMVPMFRTWPIMGAGLESFEWMFPLYQPEGQPGFFAFAENDYAQTLTDTGIVGGVMVLAFVAIMVHHWIGSYRGRQPIHLASIGIAMALVAIMVHSFSDFSQHTPAIALVTAVLLGLTVSLHRLAQAEARAASAEEPSFDWTPWPRWVATALVLLVMGWSVWSLDSQRRAETLVYESEPSASSFKAAASDPEFEYRLGEYYDEPIDADLEATRLDPTNVLYKYWLNHLRWRKLTARHDEKTGEVIFPPHASDVGQKIISEMAAARVLCPAYGKLYTLMGAIQWEFADQSAATANLELGRKRRPADAEPLYYLARAAALQGRWDAAGEYARKCCKMNVGFSWALTALYVRVLHRPDMAAQIFNDNPGALGQLTGELSDHPDLLQATRRRILELANEGVKADPKDAGAWALLGRSESELGNKDRAIDDFRNALELDYGNVQWRMTLARLLQDTGQKDDAVQEVEICLRVQPQNEQAKALLATLTTLVAPPIKP